MNYVDEVAEAIRKEAPRESIPDSDTESLFILYALLCLAKGQEVSGEDVHDAWSTWMTLRGEQHASLVPYDRLPSNVRAEDSAFVLAIRRVASRLER